MFSGEIITLLQLWQANAVIIHLLHNFLAISFLFPQKVKALRINNWSMASVSDLVGPHLLWLA